MRTRPPSPSTSIYTYVKAGMVFAATTATYFFARATGVFPTWFNWQESTEVIPYSTNNIDLFDQFSPGSKPVQDLTLTSPSEILIHSDSQKLLGITSTDTHPVPDQVIEATALYQKTLTDIFPGNFTFIDAMGTGGNGLPSWLNLQYKLISNYNKIDRGLSVAVQGSKAYVLGGVNSIFQILNISNPANPELLATGIGTGIAPCVFCHIEVSENIAYIPAGIEGLQIVNVSNDDLRMISVYLPAGGIEIWDVAISGRTAFIACDSNGLQILDINTPDNPQLLGGYSTQLSDSWGVAVSGHTVFIADWAAGLQIFNATDFTHPQILATYPPSPGGNGYRVLVSNNIAFMSSNTAGLQILDITNPADPLLLFTYPVNTGGCAYGLAISGNVLFIADGLAGVQILDVNNPKNPRLISVFSTPDTAYDVAISGSYVYIADNSAGLQIINLSQASLAGVPTISNMGQRFSLTVGAGNTSTLSMSDVFTLTIDQLPRLVQSALTDQSIFPGNSWSFSLNNNLLFTNPSDSFLKLSVLQKNGQPVPVWLNCLFTPLLIVDYPAGTDGNVYDVAMSENMIFVADYTAGLQILQISPDNTISLIGYYLTGVFPMSVVVNNSLVIVGDAFGRLQIMDISNINNPQLISTYDDGLRDNALRVVILNNTVFVARNTMGLLIVDINNPLAPTLLSTFSTRPGAAMDVSVANGIAYIAGWNAGLFILDVTNPRVPVFLSTYSLQNNFAPSGVAISGNTLFVANNDFGLQIFDVSKRANPTLQGSYPVGTGGYSQRVAISGNTAFLANDLAGLQVLDVGNKANPLLLTTYPISSGGTTQGVTVAGNRVLVSSGTAGLQILDVAQWQLTAAPSVADVGNYNIQLTVTDALGGSATDEFTIRVEGPPQFHGIIPSQYAKVGQLFNYFIPQGFSD